MLFYDVMCSCLNGTFFLEPKERSVASSLRTRIQGRSQSPRHSQRMMTVLQFLSPCLHMLLTLLKTVNDTWLTWKSCWMKIKCLEEVVKITSSLIWDGIVPLQLTSFMESVSWKLDSIHKELPTCQYDVSGCLWFGRSSCCMFFLGKKRTDQFVQSMKQHRILQACCCRAHRIPNSDKFKTTIPVFKVIYDTASSYCTNHPSTHLWLYVILCP